MVKRLLDSDAKETTATKSSQFLGQARYCPSPLDKAAVVNGRKAWGVRHPFNYCRGDVNSETVLFWSDWVIRGTMEETVRTTKEQPILQSAVPHIECVEGRCGGKPVVLGTKVRVWDIYVQHELKGKSVSEVVAMFPSVSIAQAHAALAYYYDNKAEIDTQMSSADLVAGELMSTLGKSSWEAR